MHHSINRTTYKCHSESMRYINCVSTVGYMVFAMDGWSILTDSCKRMSRCYLEWHMTDSGELYAISEIPEFTPGDILPVIFSKWFTLNLWYALDLTNVRPLQALRFTASYSDSQMTRVNKLYSCSQVLLRPVNLLNLVLLYFILFAFSFVKRKSVQNNNSLKI